jgi:oligopeptide/dipeptide ABC transporter ATP-binding protein
VVFTTYVGRIHAVNGASLAAKRGESVGIVGETGCGKSTVGFAIVRLLEGTGRVVQGQVFLEGENLLDKDEREMREIRKKRISLIFQDPTSSLNPVQTIGAQLSEALIASKNLPKDQAAARTIALLSTLGIPDPAAFVGHYPHEISGGMRQRVMIAIALSKDPALLIADEPTSNLDVTIQAQILDILRRMKEEMGMTILLITHDMGVVAQTCDKVAVMYAGAVVEFGEVRRVFSRSMHPYTRGLLKVANLVGEKTRLENIPGLVPDLAVLPIGCLYSSRCPLAKDACLKFRPELVDLGDGHFVACPVTSARNT